MDSCCCIRSWIFTASVVARISCTHTQHRKTSEWPYYSPTTTPLVVNIEPCPLSAKAHIAARRDIGYFLPGPSGPEEVHTYVIYKNNNKQISVILIRDTTRWQIHIPLCKDKYERYYGPGRRPLAYLLYCMPTASLMCAKIFITQLQQAAAMHAVLHALRRQYTAHCREIITH